MGVVSNDRDRSIARSAETKKHQSHELAQAFCRRREDVPASCIADCSSSLTRRFQRAGDGAEVAEGIAVGFEKTRGSDGQFPELFIMTAANGSSGSPIDGGTLRAVRCDRRTAIMMVCPSSATAVAAGGGRCSRLRATHRAERLETKGVHPRSRTTPLRD